MKIFSNLCLGPICPECGHGKLRHQFLLGERYSSLIDEYACDRRVLPAERCVGVWSRKFLIFFVLNKEQCKD